MLSCAGECLDSSDKCPKKGKIVFLTLLTGNMIIKYYTHYSLEQSTWEGIEDARGWTVAGCGTQGLLLRTIYH